MARLLAEQEKRHSRFGDTIYLLEPDLKSGPGGIRDMCAGRWAAFARFGTGDPFALRDLGQMSARQAAAFEAARDFLLKLRVALHLEAGRRQDQLRFDLQERLAPALYPHVARGGRRRALVGGAGGRGADARLSAARQGDQPRDHPAACGGRAPIPNGAPDESAPAS